MIYNGNDFGNKSCLIFRDCSFNTAYLIIYARITRLCIRQTINSVIYNCFWHATICCHVHLFLIHAQIRMRVAILVDFHQISMRVFVRFTGNIQLTVISALMQLLFSFDQAMNVEKLSCKLSLVKSCSRLVKQSMLRKLSCKLSLVNSHATHVLVWSSNECWENSHVNSRLSSLVLVWSSNQCWENSHVNSFLSTLMQLLFSFDQAMNVEETLM